MDVINNNVSIWFISCNKCTTLIQDAKNNVLHEDASNKNDNKKRYISDLETKIQIPPPS